MPTFRHVRELQVLSEVELDISSEETPYDYIVPLPTDRTIAEKTPCHLRSLRENFQALASAPLETKPQKNSICVMEACGLR